MPVALDNSSSSTPSGTSNLSWSHTISGSLGTTGALVVFISSENNSNNITGATFNGVAMTEIISNGNGAGNGSFLKMYELHGSNVPTSGTYTVTGTFSGFDGSANSRIGAAFSISGVKNQAPEASASTNANGTTSFGTSVTTVTANAFVVVGYSSQNTATFSSTSTGETMTFTNLQPVSGEQSNMSAGYKTVVTAGSTASTFSVSNPEAEAMGLIAFQATPATSGGAFLLNMI